MGRSPRDEIDGTELDERIRVALDADLARRDACFDFTAGLADVYARAGLTSPRLVPGPGRSSVQPEIDGTRPGGFSPGQQSAGSGFPNHQQVTEERSMLRRHSCVSIHCDQCGTTPGGGEFDTHYPTVAAAFDAAAAEGWQPGPGRRLLCSACGPVLICEAEGHQFTAWHRPTGAGQQAGGRWCGCDPDVPVHLVGSVGCGREFRYCRRCCLHESRTVKAVA